MHFEGHASSGDWMREVYRGLTLVGLGLLGLPPYRVTLPSTTLAT